MAYNKIIDTLIDEAKSEFIDSEAFLVSSEELSIEIYDSEISKYNVAQSGGLSFRGIYNGNMGYSYTEKIDYDSIKKLIKDAKDNSIIIEGDKEEIYSDITEYNEVENIDILDEVSISKKIDFLKNLEKEALSIDERISTNTISYDEIKITKIIKNSNNISLEYNNSYGVIYISVKVVDGEDIKTGSSYRIVRDFNTLDYKEIAKEAVDDGISMLGAREIESGSYPVIIENTTFASLLSSFVSIFTAEAIQKDMSLLKDKIGEKISSDLITIYDNPNLANGLGNRSFDDEGVPTSCKKVIDRGVLKTYLYNLKTAKKDKTESTGNAGRSYKGQISTTISNFYIENGKSSMDELLNKNETTVYINSLQGLHSGLNQVSGDFSLSASGYLYNKNKKIRPINRITISGNFFEIINKVGLIANDLKFGLSGGGKIASPSILIENLDVAGK